MLIDKSRRFLFVHVQKTAGISMEKTIRRCFPEAETWHGRHGRACVGIREIGREEWDGYFSFAFVRNPWDRLVSWYAMIQAARKNLPFFKRFSGRPFDTELWNYAVRTSRDFESFLENCTEVVFDRDCDKSFAYNQIDYLTDDRGELAVDFIGRFENLAADAAQVLQRLGVDSGALPRLNSSAHAHYSEWYTDRTRDLVARRFARDIDAFGYQFRPAAA